MGTTTWCYEMRHQNRERALGHGLPVSEPCRKHQDATIRATPHATLTVFLRLFQALKVSGEPLHCDFGELG